MAGRVKMVRCSFCGKSEDQVRKLISGPAGIYICDECVEICSEIIEEEEENNPYDHRMCSGCGNSLCRT